MKLAAVRRKLERVDRLVTRALEAGETSGCAVVAAEGEELGYEGCFGLAVQSPERHPVELGTCFDLASLTKVLATTPAILLLVADGKLRLDQRVADLMPAFGEHGKREIRIRHLLAHSSGLRPWRAYFDDLRERELRRGEKLLGTRAGRDAIVTRIARGAPVHGPGEAAVYGDLGFIILGDLVERVSGETLECFCARRVFEPLGLGLHFNRLPFEGDRRHYAATEECAWREKVLWGEVHDPNAWAMGGVAGHAGLFGTAKDVLRFGIEMLAADRGESAIFPQELTRRFFERQPEPPQSDRALGWDTPTEGQSTSGRHFSRRSIGHTGFTGTSLWIDLEEGVAVAMLANRVHLIAKRSRFALRPQVHDAIREAFLAA